MANDLNDQLDVKKIKAKLLDSFRCMCRRKMNAVIVGYLPVPEGYYLGYKIQLTCPSCKKIRVAHFYPLYSSDNEALDKLDLPTKLNDRVAGAICEICNLIWDYERHPAQSAINIDCIAKILEPLQKEDFPLLYAELDYRATDTSLGKIFLDSSAEKAEEKKVIYNVVELVKMVEEKKKSF